MRLSDKLTRIALSGNGRLPIAELIDHARQLERYLEDERELALDNARGIDELTLVIKGLRDERDELRADRGIWRRRAVWAGKVLWALRPVLKHLHSLNSYNWFTVEAALIDLDVAEQKYPWLEEWLND